MPATDHQPDERRRFHPSVEARQSTVEQHGGQLWAVANDGPGTTFHFTVCGSRYRTLTRRPAFGNGDANQPTSTLFAAAGPGDEKHGV